MAFDFASAKANARRVVHKTFGVQAFYSDDSISDPKEIKARWHNKKMDYYGDLDNGGYATIAEGIDRIIFFRDRIDCESVILDADEFPLTIKRSGVVTFPSLPGVEFELDHMEPVTGPFEEPWAVTRK